MIIRPATHWFLRLFAWHGSVLPHILFRLGLNLAMALLAVLLVHEYEALGVHLTTAPFSLLGVAIAIFLGFRNSASYARFLEARQLWGNLLIAARSLLRQVQSVLPDPQDAAAMAGFLSAFAWALQHQLRGTDPGPDLQRLLPPEFLADVAASPMPANRILLHAGKWLGDRRRAGAIGDVVYATLERDLCELSTVLGGCERIADTPIPFAYGLILHRTVYLYCTLLPFGLVQDLKYMTPLVSVFISYTFLSLESLAEELEDPFGTASNDLPLHALCVGIERQMLEMTDAGPLPAPTQPDGRFNLV